MYNGLRPSNIREENMKQIIKLFRSEDELFSRAQISRKLSLSAPSVSSIVNNMIEKNILYERKEGNSSESGGRKPIMLALNKECGYILGIHIESDFIIIVLANISGVIKEKINYEYQQDNNFDPISFLQKKIGKILKDNYINNNDLLTIAISIPGIFDNDLEIIKLAPNVKKWEEIDIKNELEKLFNCQVIIENAVNTAVLGEKRCGKINGYDNAVYLKIDEGIGAGILINGQLYKGFKGLAGEVGFMVSNSNDLTNKKSEIGSLENNCSTKSILAKARDILDSKSLTFNDLIINYRNDNKELKILIDKCIYEISIMISNISSIINPEIIVIGGDFTKIINLFFDDMLKLINNIVPFAPKIVCSDLGDAVYYLGVISQALTDIENLIIENIE